MYDIGLVIGMWIAASNAIRWWTDSVSAETYALRYGSPLGGGVCDRLSSLLAACIYTYVFFCLLHFVSF